ARGRPPRRTSAEQERAMERTGTYPLDQPPDQWHVPLRADLPGQPQPRRDHHRQRHPHYTALFLYTALVGLVLPEVPRLLNKMLLHGLPVHPSAPEPTRHGPLVIAKRHDDGLQWTPMGHQRHHETHRLGRGTQAIEGRALCGTERLMALCAHEA